MISHRDSPSLPGREDSAVWAATGGEHQSYGAPLPRWRDARRRLSQAAIANAVLELAAVQPASTLSVAAVAARAGINRATFYAHAASAVGFLQAFMALRLRERVLAVDAISAQPSLRTFVTPVVAHIERYRAVYQTAFSDPAARTSLADGVCLQLRVKLLESRLEIEPDQAAVISSTITQAIFVELETERPLSVDPIITMLASATYVVNQLL
ncbi:TetR family transcriptional regulator [Plantibacter sp. VKM Ac-2885]|uniref:TetR/AcrR family transcriptional regulator n=1 Tax=Plantibacter sp. VKM Ac-2885 TaxID=2783828 RepID=UPI00188D6022|nr:TetR family transcriptional regulator [Plantibacter sp. VKM Ac-2885]MBF4514168.1 TetR family transcriptional regulator [Plantibacter sp. VKM Ac-2885]